MAQSTNLPSDLQALIGSEMTGEPDHIESNDIRFFAEAIRMPGPPLPAYHDELHVRPNGSMGLLAPPTYMTRLARHGGYPWPLRLPPWLQGNVAMNAGAHLEINEPILAGDVIFTTARVADIYEKVGSSGRLLFFVHDFHFTNQLGQDVGTARRTTVKFRDRPTPP